eukprot:scaffold16765_cov33-Phaeocystis_antarctica.AAC.1
MGARVRGDPSPNPNLNPNPNPNQVREFAVTALRERASDPQLLSYLLPLVQALQYEAALPLPPDEAPLAALLIGRA